MSIQELPKEISILYNLQTLNLCGCIRLGRLPEDMKCMENLRHLYTNGCSSLKCMPPGLGQLTSLQTLTYFVVSSSPGCSTIRELHDLNLGGDLELYQLQYATEVDAKACSLGNKEKLTHLSLKWSDDSSDELDQHRNVLDALKPHAALEFLKIQSYSGNGFPAWVVTLNFLQHLTELQLHGCTMCEEFPQFGQFRSLEVLVLKRLNKLQSLCNHNSSALFPALKDLTLKKLEIFERWVATEGEELEFPQLENVKIKDCPKLAILPEAAKLKFIGLREEKAQLSLSIFKSRYMSCLSGVGLSVSDDTEAAPMTELDQDCEISLSNLLLDGCNFLFCSTPLQPTVGVWQWFGQLVHLTIKSCDMLIYWPEEEFRSLVSLNTFAISYCSRLIGHTQGKGCRTQVRDQLLPNLKQLRIACCESLTELFVLPSSLTDIDIQVFNSLESILGQDDTELEIILHFDTASSSEHFHDLTSTCLLELSPSPRINPLPCLDYLRILSCKKLRFVPAQLDALKFLDIDDCDGLESLDCLGDLPLLETLYLTSCKHLASVPGSLRNYSALQKLSIEYCPALNLKPLYGHLQQRLDSLELKNLSNAGSSYRPKLWEPKSWKYMVPSQRKHKF
ncbi:hypothetical protein ACQJBY_000392 [Aegilops geniculata]